MSQQQWNEAMGRKTNDSRSPKSEMLSRERDPMGSGMGRKSNSTSQLSATGLFIYSSHCSRASSVRLCLCVHYFLQIYFDTNTMITSGFIYHSILFYFNLVLVSFFLYIDFSLVRFSWEQKKSEEMKNKMSFPSECGQHYFELIKKNQSECKTE